MEEMEENSGAVELDPESEPPQAVLEISLHALSGVSTPRTMWVTGLVKVVKGVRRPWGAKALYRSWRRGAKKALAWVK